MFKDLAEITGEGDLSVICSRCLITFFEDGAAGSLPGMNRAKMTSIISAISSHNSFNKIGLSLPGQLLFPGFRF